MRARRLEIRADRGREWRRGDDAGEGSPAQDPAPQRPVMAHIHRQSNAPVAVFADVLRRVPHAGADVRRDVGGELKFYALGRPGVYTERIGEDIRANVLLRRERLLLERD